MNTADLMMLFIFFFQALMGLTSASHVSLSYPTIQPLSPTSSAARIPISGRDDDEDHLCDNSTSQVSLEYGNQTQQADIIEDCKNLSASFRGYFDYHRNLTQSCSSPQPPGKRSTGGFSLLGSEGNCTLWFDCFGNDSRNEVAFGWGDIAGVFKLAIDGLGSFRHNTSSLLSVSAWKECQSLRTGWVVAFNSSKPGIGSQLG